MLPLTHLTYHVLLALADSDRHGYGIIKEVLERTGGRMELEIDPANKSARDNILKAREMIKKSD